MGRDGLIRRTVHAEVPLRVEYQLTALGQTLRPVLEARLGGNGRYLRGAFSEAGDFRLARVQAHSPAFFLPSSITFRKARLMRV